MILPFLLKLENMMEVDDYLKAGTLLSEADFRHPTDEDDFYIISLYRYTDGHHFRYVENSGMNSQFNGTMHHIDWLTQSQISNWKDA